jgi:hypothetical protein
MRTLDSLAQEFRSIFCLEYISVLYLKKQLRTRKIICGVRLYSAGTVGPGPVPLYSGSGWFGSRSFSFNNHKLSIHPVVLPNLSCVVMNFPVNLIDTDSLSTPSKRKSLQFILCNEVIQKNIVSSELFLPLTG